MTAALLATSLCSLGGGCTYWFPHSLVPADRPILNADAGRADRVEAAACRMYVLAFPAGGENPTIDNVMAALHEKVPKASAFRDIRIDESFTNYFFWLVAERCVSATAEPLYAVITPKPPAEPTEGAPPGGTSPAANKPQFDRRFDPPTTSAPAQ